MQAASHSSPVGLRSLHQKNNHPALSLLSYGWFSLVVCYNRSSRPPTPVSTPPTVKSPLARSQGSTKPKKSKGLASLRVDSGHYAPSPSLFFPSATPRYFLDAPSHELLSSCFPADRGLGFIVTLPYPIYPCGIIRRFMCGLQRDHFLLPLKNHLVHCFCWVGYL